MHRISIFVLACLLTACATTNDTPGNMNTMNQATSNWQGKSIQEVKQHWGKPDAVVASGTGTTHYVYFTKAPSMHNSLPNYRTTTVIAGRGHAIGVALPTAQTNKVPGLSCTRTFEANAQDIVIAVKTKGSCPG